MRGAGSQGLYLSALQVERQKCLKGMMVNGRQGDQCKDAMGGRLMELTDVKRGTLFVTDQVSVEHIYT